MSLAICNKCRPSYVRLCRGTFQNPCSRSLLFIHGKTRLGDLLVLERADIDGESYAVVEYDQLV